MLNARIQRLWQLDAEWGHAAWRASPHHAERVLHVYPGTPEELQTSLCRALASLAGNRGYRRVNWTELPSGERHRHVVEAAAELRPTLIFMQLQGPGVLSCATIAEMRRVARTSELVIISWCGEVGGINGPFRTPGDQWAYELSVHCDLMLYTSMSQVRALRSHAMHNAAYLQFGYDEDRYFEGPDGEYGSQFDVAFHGANCDDPHWMSLPGHDAGLHRDVVEAMRTDLGSRFGLFGRDWGSDGCQFASAQGGDIYRRSHLVLHVSICSFLERYSSDRLLHALACGTPILLKTFDDWRSFGLANGQNVLAWDTSEEARALTRAWLAPTRRAALRHIGRAGAALAREHHSWGVRMQELYALVLVARGMQAKVTRPW